MHESFPDSVRTERMQFAEDLWQKIIAARALELKPGGLLLMANAANHSEHPFGQDYASEDFLNMVKKVAQNFRIDVQMNVYQRTIAEFKLPFLDSPHWDSVVSENVTEGCAYYKKFLSDKDTLGEESAKEIFSNDIAASFRAFSESRVKTAFNANGVTDAEELNGCLNDFYNLAKEECKKSPERSRIDFKVNFLLAKRSEVQ